MALTLLTLLQCGIQPTQARQLLAPMSAACERFEINTPGRLAAFFAQLRVESEEFTRIEENLRYRTPQRIRDVWPSRFRTAAEAAPFVLKPKELANRVYANRNGNGDEASGDGWRYRGRAWKQITGLRNYELAAAGLGRPYVEQPELLIEPEDAAMVSAWYWASFGCNGLADTWQLDVITRRVNGPAMLKADDRRSFADQALRELMEA